MRSKPTLITLRAINEAVFPRQITNFTGCRRIRVTCNDLATLVRVQMRQSAIAVSAAWNGLVVNMVVEGTNEVLEANELGIDNNTGAVAVGSEGDLSGHGAVSKDSGITVESISSTVIVKNVREEGDQRSSSRIIFNKSGIAEKTSGLGLCRNGSDGQNGRGEEGFELHLD